MAATNTLLTPSEITRECLRVLHQKLTFVGSIYRGYDDRFAKSGAKIGDTISIRLPAQYTVRKTATYSAQDSVDQSVDFKADKRYGVDMDFSSQELTLDIDRFSERYIEPAMAVIAANLEADAYADMYKSVWNMVDNDAAALSFLNLLQGRAILNKNLAPMDNNRHAMLSNDHSVKVINEMKAYFNDPKELARQYREGEMGRAAGLNFAETTHANLHTTGTCAKTTGYAVNGNQTTNGDTTITVKTGANTFKAGDVITVAGCFRVHPETKATTNELQHFVVTSDYAGGAGELNVSPPIYTSGGRQNVVATGWAADAAIVKVGAGASETLTTSMVYHRDAFAFGTVDLIMPEGVDFAARESYDGISMRIVRQYSLTDDLFPCRIDVLGGWKAIRPQLACRLHADG